MGEQKIQAEEKQGVSVYLQKRAFLRASSSGIDKPEDKVARYPYRIFHHQEVWQGSTQKQN